MIPASWSPTWHGWVREDGLLVEFGARIEGERSSPLATPVAGWNVGVDRGAVDGDGLDKRYPDLGTEESIWFGAVPAFEAVAAAEARWPFCADLAAKLPPRRPALRRSAPATVGT